jgi:hypothetical protein
VLHGSEVYPSGVGTRSGPSLGGFPFIIIIIIILQDHKIFLLFVLCVKWDSLIKEMPKEEGSNQVLEV